MNKIAKLIQTVTVMAMLACLPSHAAASFFGSDPLVSYKKTDLDRSAILPVIALLDKSSKDVLRKDKQQLELLLRKEVIRNYLITQAKDKKLDKQESVALQMQVAADHQLYTSYVAAQTKIPDGYPTQAELEQFYKNNSQQLMIPEQVHLRQIFLKVDADKSYKKRLKEINFIRKQIEKGKKTFAEYATSHSDHKESAKNGGDMGWTPMSSMLPEIRSVLKNKSKKKNLEIVKTDAGIHLIELLESRPATIAPLAMIKDQLTANMRTQHKVVMEQAYLADLRKKNPSSIKNFELLKDAIASQHREAFKSKLNVVVASMGAVELTLDDFLKRVEALERLQSNTPLNMDDAFIKQTLIGNVLLKQFVIKTASDQKWNKRDEVKLRSQRAADDILVQAMLEKLSTPPSSFPSAKDLKAAYNANKEKLVQPESVHIAQIFVAVSKDEKRNKTLDKAMQDIHGLLIKNPQSFAELAKKYSQNAASKSKGGDMGWLSVDSLLPAMKKAVAGMSEKSISPVIKSEQGWHILTLLGHRQAGPISFSEIKPALTNTLRAAELKKRVQENINAMISDKSISIDQSEMDKLIGNI